MKRVNLGLLASTFLIAACGGGDGSSFGGGEPVSDSFPITAANGEQATRLSYEAAIATVDRISERFEVRSLENATQVLVSLKGGVARNPAERVMVN